MLISFGTIASAAAIASGIAGLVHDYAIDKNQSARIDERIDKRFNEYIQSKENENEIDEEN